MFDKLLVLNSIGGKVLNIKQKQATSNQDAAENWPQQEEYFKSVNSYLLPDISY